MGHIDLCLALLDASPACQDAVARRTRGDVLGIDRSESRSLGWLDRVDVVAWLGAEIDWPLVNRCLQAQKHVVMAAASCSSHESLAQLVELDRDSHGRLHLGNPIASLPSRQTIRQQCQQGKLGELGLVRVHRWSSSAAGLSAPLLYEIDSVLDFFQQPPARVFASEYADGRGCAVHLGWADGPMATIDFVLQPIGQAEYASFSVIGSRGSAYADDHANSQLRIGHQATGLTVPETSDWHAHMLVMLLRGLSRQARPQGHQTAGVSAYHDRERSGGASLSHWRRTMRVAEALFESLSTRGVVEPDY